MKIMGFHHTPTIIFDVPTPKRHPQISPHIYIKGCIYNRCIKNNKHRSIWCSLLGKNRCFKKILRGCNNPPSFRGWGLNSVDIWPWCVTWFWPQFASMNCVSMVVTELTTFNIIPISHFLYNFDLGARHLNSLSYRVTPVASLTQIWLQLNFNFSKETWITENITWMEHTHTQKKKRRWF